MVTAIRSLVCVFCLEQDDEARLSRRQNAFAVNRHVLPGKEGDVGVTAKDNKLFVDAVLYRYRAGIPWARPTGTVRRPDQCS
jgi:hypothetical protein